MKDEQTMYRESELNECRKIIVIGASQFASLMTAYIEEFSAWDILTYAVDKEYLTSDEFCKKPLMALSDVQKEYPPEYFSAFIAVGYNQMGDIRKRLFNYVKSVGYHVLNFIHPTSLCYAKSIGEGNIFLENSVISLRSKIGNGNLIWNGCQLGHDLVVGNFNTFCAGSIISGDTHVGDNCFFGVGSAVRNGVEVAPYTFVGMQEQLNHNSKIEEAYTKVGSTKAQKMSSRKIMKFFELSE